MKKYIIYLLLNVMLVFSVLAQQSDHTAKAKALVDKMTLEEKALLLSGDGWWETHSIDRLDVPSIFVSDGPHGLRKAKDGALGESVPATCFPTASGLAASWNTDLLHEVGVALAREAQANDVQILLGPGVNMKRSPLGGRNFEYFSEDPLLAGELAAAYIRGVQEQGVGTSIKHFTANNQEYERMANSSNVDERTLHEIYLPAFENAIKEAHPWSVMCAYNKLNGVYASENSLLLQNILRDQWGFKGFVVSDWGAVNNRVEGVKAGLNLEMPGSGDINRNKIIEAVKAGEISEERLDEITTQLLAVILKGDDMHDPKATYDKEAHHALARKAGGESIVLLKNDNDILPLNTQKTKNIAIIGAFAKNPRYQGAGSSQVNPTRIANAYDELVKLSDDVTFKYAQGYDMEGAATDEQIKEAREVAGDADVAIVFAGLPASYESEGFDRSTLDMPEGHNELIEQVAKVNPNVVVVLMNGAPVTMSWVDKVQGIVEGYLGGQAGGGAIADVLTGKVNPSAKLAETFPMRLEDTPTALEYPGRNLRTDYGEGIFIGYRYYDRKKIEPLFPFGYGLSYTTFDYSDLKVSASTVEDTDSLTVSLKVKNTGKVAGKEIVQLYVHDQQADVVRPAKELKAFKKVMLNPGEEQSVSLKLGYRDYAYWDTSIHDWTVESGDFDIMVGRSSRDLALKHTVRIEATKRKFPKLTRTSLLKEFRDHPKGKEIYSQLIKVFGQQLNAGQEEDKDLTPEEKAAKEKEQAMMMAFLNDLPVNKLVTFSGGKFTEEQLQEMLKQVQ